jgi:hypothetical protein
MLDNTGQSERFVALNRIIRTFSQRHQVWYFFLSTESMIDEVLPPDNALRDMAAPERPSWRGDFRLKRVSPLTEFAVDIPDIWNNPRFTLKRGNMACGWYLTEYQETITNFSPKQAHLIMATPNLHLQRLWITFTGGSMSPLGSYMYLQLYLFDLNLANPVTIPC